MSIEDTLEQRDEVYGNFEDQAMITMRLKAVIRALIKWERLACDQQEALEMICVKMARIMNGDPNYVDNWHDIAGYATLVAARLAAEEKV
jgi:hypothetical protein